MCWGGRAEALARVSRRSGVVARVRRLMSRAGADRGDRHRDGGRDAGGGVHERRGPLRLQDAHQRLPQ
eukprot:3425426-Rhodomonas_salina.1